ncbi:bifunctional glutamate N-acetyltransferase/amino-acid acetyltransferase ArgJ [Rhodopirellula sp. MGV]|uniref:bifunctional glutamate N-acetyltransferase/amino-acid acetyltransferase ArgJ n=1 Tax=Rhodopirellula sp. MGV TaxID=2023130 RepID=UPI000B9669E9|nr:bifunctional glutamate N-acetyltransferase/amino-acid acetyltransferase ArgJ [Rhodopirellula sp. MGV]OYP28846.1 bifunctional ornithine acetyltransferase/N-acetylglutamate synthase [Rhodopirellula sp. MGV]PNY37565.1 bifunctional glutamate N-acetyltransferase/amino-acid acetyltransferase ArgJ [Rhodopirellula baltica]
MPENVLPRGFRFGGVTCGIKASGRPDLSLIVCDQPVAAAGVYTTNQIVAAPVTLCKSRTPSSSIRAVITNSGNANACTGEQGALNAAEMCRLVATKIGASDEQVLVMSTGIIGKPLPMERIKAGIDSVGNKLGDSIDDFQAAASAILTTDKGPKTAHREVKLGGVTVRLSAMAKGAGMIAPNMATMLAVVMTDAAIAPEMLKELLTEAADLSFNRVSVDGHTSTNDTLLALASGESGVEITAEHKAAFAEVMNDICTQLARELVSDGEGAQHVMKIHVTGAKDDHDANGIAKAIGESPLVKTAMTGGDPNWGRIVSAAGYAGFPIQPNLTTLEVCGTKIFENGAPLPFEAAALSRTMKATPEVDIELTVGDGPGEATRWASDLTCEYVRFNSEYTT